MCMTQWSVFDQHIGQFLGTGLKICPMLFRITSMHAQVWDDHRNSWKTLRAYFHKPLFLCNIPRFFSFPWAIMLQNNSSRIAFTKYLPCVRLSSKQWMYIISLNSHNNLMKMVLLSFLFHRLGNWGPERLSNLPKVAQLYMVEQVVGQDLNTRSPLSHHIVLHL